VRIRYACNALRFYEPLYTRTRMHVRTRTYVRTHAHAYTHAERVTAKKFILLDAITVVEIMLISIMRNCNIQLI